MERFRELAFDMVSVVIVAYNVERYIQKCIDSVVGQTFKDIEIIIVDSGSTDETSIICETSAQCDRRIIYVKKEAEGPGPARTMGLHEAKGRYVTFVDGDDMLEKDAIAEMLRVAERGEADIVLGDIIYVYERECDADLHEHTIEKIYSKIRWNSDDYMSVNKAESIINRCRTFTWGKLYRRDFLLENGFEQGSYAYEDVATIPVLIAKAKKIGYVNKPVYNYLRNRTTSIVNDKTKAKDMLVALNALYDDFQKMEGCKRYENELKRLMWSQIRFICIKHREVMAYGKEEKSTYKRMIEFMRGKSPEFIVPDECNIELIGYKKARVLLNNLLICQDNFEEREGKDDKDKCIVVRYAQNIKIYDLSAIKEDYLLDESYIWDIVDDIFEKIWC